MFSATLREWKRKIEQLRQRWRAVRQENERLRKETEVLRRREKQWESEREQWERERKRLREEIDNLKRQLEEAQRANKRQAAPFSRGTRKEHPKTPGRKPGAAYGRRYCKLPPKQVDEIVPVPLLGREFAESSTISRTRLAPRRFRMLFSRAPREGSRLSLVGPLGFFQLLSQPVIFFS